MNCGRWRAPASIPRSRCHPLVGLDGEEQGDVALDHFRDAQLDSEFREPCRPTRLLTTRDKRDLRLMTKVDDQSPQPSSRALAIRPELGNWLNLQVNSRVEPAGIEPTTSCLQTG
jgi:hypothetical protein